MSFGRGRREKFQRRGHREEDGDAGEMWNGEVVARVPPLRGPTRKNRAEGKSGRFDRDDREEGRKRKSSPQR
jgi:hypothetical protein